MSHPLSAAGLADQPACVVGRLEDDWHAFVDGRHEFV
jgi:hypothetical protein